MRLTSLDVSAVRNLSSVGIQPGPGVNLFYGVNGAGKTSLLEAISILSTGRSFRAGKISTVISSDLDHLVVGASVEDSITLSKSRIGIQRAKNETTARIDGANVKRLSMLASALPCVIISTSNHELVEGGPSERRSFLDWLLFHVEPQFLNFAQRYRSALQQRNAALRKGASDDLVALWHSELAEAGQRITEGRKRILQEFSTVLSDNSHQFNETLTPLFSYRAGWPEDLSLEDALARLDHCRRRGITTVGPHRADLVIKTNGQEARYVYSRGQQKLLAIQMRLAQVDMFTRFHQQPPIVLFDDLPSELDEQARRYVFRYLEERRVQVFLTSVDDVSKELQNACDLFHVKQGKIEKVLY